MRQTIKGAHIKRHPLKADWRIFPKINDKEDLGAIVEIPYNKNFRPTERKRWKSERIPELQRKINQPDIPENGDQQIKLIKVHRWWKKEVEEQNHVKQKQTKLVKIELGVFPNKIRLLSEFIKKEKKKKKKDPQNV